MDKEAIEASLASKLALILPQLTERQRRLVLGAEARALGHGGVSLVARAAQVSRTTVHAALADLDKLADPDTAAVPDPERSRRRGGGRHTVLAHDPTLLADLDALVEPTTRGDPMSPLRWTCKSTRQLAAALREKGHQVSHQTVAALLEELDYSLRAPARCWKGRVIRTGTRSVPTCIPK
jgi:sulfur carrier protein ThiS